jgi:hypothetical protein
MSYTRRTEPTVITKGERVTWTKSYADYPASEYTLQYRFRWTGSGAGAGIDVNASAEGDDFNVVIANTVSDDFTQVGRHKWQAWVTEIADATNKILVGEGFVTVKAGFVAGTLTAVDTRSAAKIALDSIDAAMTAFATGDVLEYEITTPAGSRRVKRSSRADLIQLRKHYAAIVARENAAERMRNGGSFGQRIDVVLRER